VARLLTFVPDTLRCEIRARQTIGMEHPAPSSSEPPASAGGLGETGDDDAPVAKTRIAAALAQLAQFAGGFRFF
jgi:hypothetical protein